jgi:predicted branched-subunit amino acid permease
MNTTRALLGAEEGHSHLQLLDGFLVHPFLPITVEQFRVFSTVTRTRARISGNALAVVLMMVQLTAAASYGGGDP